MPLTAEDVVERVFKQEFRGYDREEVDTFLDDVADRIAELTKESEGLRDEAQRPPTAPPRDEQPTEVVPAPVAPPPPPAPASDGGEGFEALLKRTLLAAQRTADQTVEEANQTAQETVDAARAQADRLLADARRQAESHRAEVARRTEEYTGSVRRTVDAERQESEAGAERIRRAVDELEEFRREYRARVREVITAQLEQLDREEDLPDLPPRVGELDRVAEEEQARLSRTAAGGYDDAPSSTPSGGFGRMPVGTPAADVDDDVDTDQMEAAEVERARQTQAGAPADEIALDDAPLQQGPVDEEPSEDAPAEDAVAEDAQSGATAAGERAAEQRPEEPPADLSGAPRGTGGAPRPRMRTRREGRLRLRGQAGDTPRPPGTTDADDDRPGGGS